MKQFIIDTHFLDTLGVETRVDAPLSEYTTFRLGGTAPCVLTCQTPKQLYGATRYLIKEQLPFILFGGGSNLVVSDAGLDCVVIRYISREPVIERKGNDLVVSGSTSLDDLALYAAKAGLEGLNYTTGIPGTVGGAVVGNAGAFGKQVGDVVTSAELLSLKGQPKIAFPADLDFHYRDSMLKKTSDIVVSVRFALQPGNPSTLLKEREELLALRRLKHPNLTTHPCAGSFFRNIEPTSKAEKRQAAGWFLEQAVAKDMHCGGAVIFEKHANIIVKSEHCKAQDVYNLSVQMAQAVKEKFGFDLVREVLFVGRFDGVNSGGKVIF